MYVIKEKELINLSKSDEVYNTAVDTFTKGHFNTAAEYLGDSVDIFEELHRRQEIMNWASQMKSKTTPFPKIRN